MSIEKSVLALSPLAYYPLQETGAGVIADASGNGFHGSTVGASILYAQAGAWPSWPSQKLMKFPGSASGYVTIPNFPSLNGSHTYTAWLRKDDAAFTHQQITGQDGVSSTEATAYIKVADNVANTLLFYINTVPMSGGAVSSTVTRNLVGRLRPAITSGTTYHLAIVVDASVSPVKLTAYIDGVLVGATVYAPAGGQPLPGRGPRLLGAGYHNGNVVDYAAVSMAHFAFFARALTQTQIMRLVSVGKSNTGHTKLVGTVRLHDGTGVARKVRVHSRATGALLGETASAGDGSYSCPLYGGEIEPVFVLALDDDDAPDLNAAVLDRQLPIGA